MAFVSIYATFHTCPHCLGRVTDCCVCLGTGKIDDESAAVAVAWSWARLDCRCRTCKDVGPQPGRTAALRPVPPPVVTPKPILGQGAIPWRFKNGKTRGPVGATD